MDNIYQVSGDAYHKLGVALVETVYNRDYYSGSITICDDDIELTITGEFVMYFREVIDDEYYGAEALVDISPIWWKFVATYGIDVLTTDFSFDELKTYILW